MSGIACQIPHLAIIRPDGLPTHDFEKFDQQLLECCKQSEIIQGLVESGVGDNVCAILGKPAVSPGQFSAEDRAALYGYIEALYT